MANNDPIEWSLYDTDLVTKIGILPYVKSHLYFEFQEPGSGDVQIPLDHPIASSITSGRFIAASYRGALRGGFFVDNFKIIEADNNESAGRLLSVSGRGPLAILEDGIVWTDAFSNSTRSFTGKSKAYILYTLIAEAQARGALSGLQLNFNATTSSDAITWSDSEDLTIEVGKTLLDVLRMLSAKGDIEFTVSLQNSATPILLSAYANKIGSDKSTSIYFRVGTNCEEVGKEERGDQIKNVLLTKFKRGYVVASNSASISARRRREEILNVDSAQSADSALTYASSKLDVNKDPRTGFTLKVFDGLSPNLFIDYSLGDTVSIDKLGVIVSYRILGIQTDFDGDIPSNVTIEVNTIFRDSDLEANDKLNDLLTRWNTAKDANQLEVKEWRSVGDPDNEVYALHYFSSDGYLIVGGSFTNVSGKVNTSYIARYYPATGVWSAMGTAITSKVVAITSDVSGNIYCATDTKVYQWSGTDWTLIGTLSGAGIAIYSLFADGTDLYVTGHISSINSVTVLTNVAKYSSATWTSVGSTLQNDCLQVIKYNGVLYGGFEVAAGSNKGLQKFTGGIWSAVFASLQQEVTSLAIKGTELIFATRESASPALAAFLGSWDGVAVSWTVLGTFSLVGTGAFARIYAIETYLSDIYVSNIMTISGDSTSYKMIVKYSGGVWSNLDSDLGGTEIRAIETVNSDVYIGGLFTVKGSTIGASNNNLAIYITSFQSLIDHLINDGSFDLGAAIHSATVTTVMANTDEIPLWQAATNALRKITWSNILATLSSIYATLTDLTNHIADTSSAHTAQGVDIVDSGNYFTSTEVEGALQELGAGGIGGGGDKNTNQVFYLHNSLSDLLEDAAHMRILHPFMDAGGVQSASYTGLGSGETKTLIFATATGIPGIQTIPSGTFRFYVTAKQTAGTRSVVVRVKLYKQASGGTQTLLATSSDSTALTGAYVTYALTVAAGPFTLDITDRLILKIYVNGGGSGTNANVSLQFANADGERIEIQTPNSGDARINLELSDYIAGLQMVRVSATALTVKVGSAYIPSLNSILNSSSDIAKSSLSLSNTTWYHIYLYSNNGVADIEIVTTAPAIYHGTSYQKTGDNSRRYIGSVKTDGSGNIFNFIHDVRANLIMFETQQDATMRVLNGGTATTETNVTCSAYVPSTSKIMKAKFSNTSTTQYANIGNSEDSVTLAAGTGILVVNYANYPIVDFPLDSSQQFSYMYGAAPGTGLYVDLYGYFFER